MPRCAGHKPDGAPCERIVGASQTYCFAHDPSRSEARSKAASKAGRSKPNREIAVLKGEVRALIEDVLKGKVSQGRGAVALQGYNCLLRASDLERRIREQEEIIRRLDELERRYSNGGVRAWP